MKPICLKLASARPYTGELPPFEYPGPFIVKWMTNAGTFRFAATAFTEVTARWTA